MAMHNADNQRVKLRYFVFLKEAKRQSEDSVDALAKALARFEADTRFRDFKQFRVAQAVAFKKRLADQDSQTTGGKLSKATLHATLAHLKRFFEWLAGHQRDGVPDLLKRRHRLLAPGGGHPGVLQRQAEVLGIRILQARLVARLPGQPLEEPFQVRQGGVQRGLAELAAGVRLSCSARRFLKATACSTRNVLKSR